MVWVMSEGIPIKEGLWSSVTVMVKVAVVSFP